MYNKCQNEIIEELKNTMIKVPEADVEELINDICSAEKIFFVGVGRVLLALESFAKRLAHLGFKTFIVGQITEPAITDKDLLIVGSGSGESLFPKMIAQKAKSFNARIVHIGSNPQSSMNEFSNLFVRIPVQTKLNLEGEIASIQPMTSLFEQSLFILGDTISLIIIKKKKINMEELWQFHANLE